MSPPTELETWASLTTGQLKNIGMVLQNMPYPTVGASTAPSTQILVYAHMLGSDVFEMTVEDLCNLWVTKYGNEWVETEMVLSDQFFSLVHARLIQLSKLEQHYLTDRARYVCRKPE